MSNQLDELKVNNSTLSAPPKKGGEEKSFRSHDGKELIYQRFVELTEECASKEAIRRELKLSESQYQICLNLWASVKHGKQIGKATIPASCLPLEARAILGMNSGDHLVVGIPEEGGAFIGTVIQAEAAGSDKKSLN